MFVVSAGNSGPGAESIGSPAGADAALTAGAVDREDQLAEFSSRGPRTGDGYVSLSGTSMAAPHVAGAAAIQLAPDFQDFSSRPSQTRAPGYFKLTMGAILAKPDGTGTGPGFHASPYLYHVLHTDDSGGVPADLTPELADEQLAKVVSSHAVATPGMIGIREGGLTMPLPYTLTEYYTPGIEWVPSFSEAPSWDARRELSSAVGDTPRVYSLGATVTERRPAR